MRRRLDRADARAAALRSEVTELTRVAEALERDPAFAAEVARLDVGVSRLGTDGRALDRLDVPPAPAPVSFAPPPPPAEPWPTLGPPIDRLAASRRTRAGLAASAGLLLAVALTLFQPAAAGPLRTALRPITGLWSAVTRRYRTR